MRFKQPFSLAPVTYLARMQQKTSIAILPVFVNSYRQSILFSCMHLEVLKICQKLGKYRKKTPNNNQWHPNGNDYRIGDGSLLNNKSFSTTLCMFYWHLNIIYHSSSKKVQYSIIQRCMPTVNHTHPKSALQENFVVDWVHTDIASNDNHLQFGNINVSSTAQCLISFLYFIYKHRSLPLS